jgi:large subunit ribosomal protein L4e
VIENGFEVLSKTSEVIAVLTAAGVYGDVERAKQSRNVRPGRGKMRGRRYRQRKSLLIVTADQPLRAARNLPGVDAVTVGELNAELFAPGTHPGRLTVWTEGALMRLEGM